jgi:hypothetical protein
MGFSGSRSSLPDRRRDHLLGERALQPHVSLTGIMEPGMIGVIAPREVG